jgi:hypothetical protein
VILVFHTFCPPADLLRRVPPGHQVPSTLH